MTQVLPSYAFNASAVGLGGVIRQGNRTTVIPTVASVCLASAGGEASNRVDDYSRDGISFTRAETRCGGYSTYRGDSVRHATFSEVVLINLRVFDRISIARMQAVVTSTRDFEAVGNPNRDFTVELEADRTRFWVKLLYHGVEIDGEEVDAEVDNELCEATSYKDFARGLVARKARLLQETQDVLDKQNEIGAPMAGPLVGVRGHQRAMANRVDVPAFGRVRLGDYIVKPDRRRVSLFRLNLDSDWQPNSPNARRRVRTILAENSPTGNLVAQSSGDGTGGSLSSDNGSNGVPIWP